MESSENDTSQRSEHADLQCTDSVESEELISSRGIEAEIKDLEHRSRQQLKKMQNFKEILEDPDMPDIVRREFLQLKTNSVDLDALHFDVLKRSSSREAQYLAALSDLTDQLKQTRSENEDYEIVLGAQASGTAIRLFLQQEDHHGTPVDDNTGKGSEVKGTFEDGCSGQASNSENLHVAADEHHRKPGDGNTGGSHSLPPSCTVLCSVAQHSSSGQTKQESTSKDCGYPCEASSVNNLVAGSSVAMLSEEGGELAARGMVEDVPLSIVLDTGATGTILNVRVWEKIQNKPRILDSAKFEPGVFLGDGKTELKILMKALVKLQIGQRLVEDLVQVGVADIGKDDMLLGMDFWRAHRCEIIREEATGLCNLVFTNKRMPNKGSLLSPMPWNLSRAFRPSRKKDTVTRGSIGFGHWLKCPNGID